jgi:GSCFA family/Polysaccharide biosynthesis enzyme WcbI
MKLSNANKEVTSIAFRFFIKLFSGELVEAAYRGILGRAPDKEGKLAHKAALHQGDNLELLLHKLAHGQELALRLPFINLLEHHKSAHQTHINGLARVSASNKKFLLMGNCQVRGLGRLMRAMTGGAEVRAIEAVPEVIKRLETRDIELSILIAECTLIFVHADAVTLQALEKNFPADYPKVRLIPKVGFAAFHPDMDYVEDSKGAHVFGPLGAYQSTLAFFCWKQKFSKAETLRLFCEETYETLGYFEYWALAKSILINEGVLTGIAMEPLVEKWSRSGCWMYSFNHPKLLVLADIAKALLEREGIKTLPGVEEYVDDEMNSSSVWPIYPEIGKRIGLAGHYLFKRFVPFELRDMPVSMMTLAQFIDESFATFSKYAPDELTCHRLRSSRYENLLAKLKNTVPILVPEINDAVPTVQNIINEKPKANAPTSNPYEDLPDYQFWRRAIERLPISDVNPVVNARFKLSRASKVATAGSCFAQHISRTLTKHDFNYYVTETGDDLLQQNATQRNFGVFSARFGNIYTARQLVQLFDRAYGRFSPVDRYWSRDDGRLVDPFRPQIEPDGFDSIEALAQSRARHFAAVREMFEKLDIFVFTLGLTEAWRSRVDGAVFPLAPGVVAGEMDHERYEFINFEVRNVVADLQLFIGQLLAVNPSAKIILTVSPVPLIATYENQHVLVSTTYSKSVLRAAAGEIAKTNPHCDYFPSFEIITGNYNRGRYFEGDLRSITSEGVNHVMKLFLSSYSNENTRGTHMSAAQQEIINEMVIANSVVCDEEAIDAAQNQRAASD